MSRSERGNTPDVGTPSSRRRTLIFSLLLILIGASFYDIVSGDEHWPFSPYAMYSNVEREHTMTRLRAYGVTTETPEQEILLLEPEYIYPLDPSRFISALRRFEVRGDKQVLRSALADCLARYEAGRLAGRHDGPPIRAVRLYRLFWKLLPDASNVDQPYDRKLIQEVGAPDE